MQLDFKTLGYGESWSDFSEDEHKVSPEKLIDITLCASMQ